MDRKKMIDKIVWWIPFKNLRNFVRDTLNIIHDTNISISKIFQSINKIFSYINNIEKVLISINNIEKILINSNKIAICELIMKHLYCPIQYKHILLDIKEGDICIDCGANYGLFTRLVYIQKGICYSFEPNSSLYEHLLKMYKNTDNVYLYQYAVSNENKTTKFFKVSENNYFKDQGFSISINVGDYYDEIKAIKLSDFIKNEILKENNSIYLLKMDIEGEEFNVLEDIIENELYYNIKYIFVETHERFLEDGNERLIKLKNLIKERNIDNIYLDWV